MDVTFSSLDNFDDNSNFWYNTLHYYSYVYIHTKYKETEAVIGDGTGKIVTTTTVAATTTNVITTNSQLKTYADPAGFFTLQYPADLTVEFIQQVTRFDSLL